MAVLSGPLDDPTVVADLRAMEATTSRGGLALKELRAAITRSLAGARLTFGELLLIDNRTAVHGRTAFRPTYHGRDRWLRRSFVVSDLRRSRGARLPGSRVCRPLAEIVDFQDVAPV